MSNDPFADPNPDPYFPNYGSYGEQNATPDPYSYGQQSASSTADSNPYPYNDSTPNSFDPMASNASSPAYTLPPPPPHLPDYPTMAAPYQETRSRGPRLGILLLIILLLIGIGIGSLFFLIRSRGTTASTTVSNPTTSATSNASTNSSGQTILTVTSHPLIVIDNEKGFIRVHAGATSNKVILQSANGSTTAIPYTETTDLTTIIIYLSPSNAPDVDVTVPMTSDLKLYTNDSSITVSGVKGQMNLVSNSGIITVTYSTIDTASILDNNTGAISATNTILQGNVTLLNNTGTITFNGSVNPNGTYQFKGNGGLLDITLPRNGAFRIDATTNGSTVTSNFPGATVQNGEIHTNVGKLPRASITIYNNNGAVSLHVGQNS